MQAGDVGYYLVRSMDRLKKLVLEPMTDADDKVKGIKERAAFIDWHDQLVKAAQELGMLPKVVMTPRTEVGRKHGAA
jgi:hypothetical protein